MRDYDDENIRLYAPVLRRVFILLAVIIAVPVAMWTITTMVRTYIGPPARPTFRPIAQARPADTTPTQTAALATPGASQTAPPPAVAPQTAASDQTLGRRLADAGLSDAGAAMPDGKKLDRVPGPAAASPPPMAPNPQPPTAAKPTLPAAAAAIAPAPPMPQKPTAPPISAKPQVPTQSAATAMQAAISPVPPPPAVPASASAKTAKPATPPADTMNWPNPNSTSPPTIGNDRTAVAMAASTPPMPPKSAPEAPVETADASATPPPASEPMAGPVPLPPHRPMQVAMTQGPIPLPRPRPTDAPAVPASPPPQPVSTFDPGLDPGHY